METENTLNRLTNGVSCSRSAVNCSGSRGAPLATAGLRYASPGKTY